PPATLILSLLRFTPRMWRWGRRTRMRGTWCRVGTAWRRMRHARLRSPGLNITRLESSRMERGRLARVRPQIRAQVRGKVPAPQVDAVLMHNLGILHDGGPFLRRHRLQPYARIHR